MMFEFKCLSLLPLVLAIGVALPEPANAQATDGNIVGVVYDASGAILPGASVELLNTATSVRSNTSTGPQGIYRFGNLPVGTYNITVTAPGFATTLLKDVAVELNRTTTVNITLSLGAVSSAVEVTAAGSLIDTTTAQVANSYEHRLATDLPLASNPSGGVYNLALVGAGVGSSGGIGAGTGPSVGGIRPRNNNFNVEGVDNNDKNVTGPIINVPNDAVGEFTVLQNQFSAEFGRSSGGQFNVTVKSGSNQLHGSLYEYFMNRNLNANDQAAARARILSPPRYDQNRLGAESGGPVLRNRWFIYGLFEYNPTGNAGVPASPVYAPTSAGYDTLAAMTGISRSNLTMLRQYAPAAGAPVRTTPVNGVPIPIGIYTIVAPSYVNNYNWLISSDLTIGSKDQLRVRYIDNTTRQINTGAQLPVFYMPQATLGKLASVGEFHSFSPALNNELRLAWNRNDNSKAIPDLSWPGLDVFPNVGIRNDLNLNIGPDTNSPTAVVQNTSQLVDNLSWTTGRHDLKFGIDLRSQIFGSSYISRVRGDYQWTTLEKYLNDTIPDYIAQRTVGGKPYSGNTPGYYGFVQDSFRFRQNLTFSLGLRYEFNGVSKSMKEFDLNRLADVPGVLTFQAPQSTTKNFAPRVGFAWSPGRAAKTSVRGGFGIAYDQWFDNIGIQARPPQANSVITLTGKSGSGFLANGAIPPTARAAELTPAAARAATSYFLDPLQRLPYAITYNIGVEHSFGNDYTLGVRYLGTKGVHLIIQGQLNRNSLVTESFNLPTYLQMPTQATLDALKISTATLTQLQSTTAWNPLLPFGFTNAITAYQPRGNSRYDGMAIELKKRYNRNFMLNAAYTLSHTTDDSTAEFNSVVANPRHPQDLNNYAAERSDSALDHRNRLTFTALYNTHWFSTAKNVFLKNTLGNWELSGVWTAETGTWATPQSGVDSNLNGISDSDRVILNPGGVPGTSSGVTPLRNSAKETVAYLAMDPNAQYIQAQIGAYANSGRNILRTPGIANVDFSIAKTINVRERYKLQIAANMFNAVNHPQYTLGNINNIVLRKTAGTASMFIPGNPLFGKWDQVFGSNPRVMQLSLKLAF